MAILSTSSLRSALLSASRRRTVVSRPTTIVATFAPPLPAPPSAIVTPPPPITTATSLAERATSSARQQIITTTTSDITVSRAASFTLETASSLSMVVPERMVSTADVASAILASSVVLAPPSVPTSKEAETVVIVPAPTIASNQTSTLTSLTSPIVSPFSAPKEETLITLAQATVVSAPVAKLTTPTTVISEHTDLNAVSELTVPTNEIIRDVSKTPLVSTSQESTITNPSISYGSDTVVAEMVTEEDLSDTTTRSTSIFFEDPVTTSGSFAIGSDLFNLDTLDKDLRSYSGELLSSFDQIESTYPECEILALIRDDNKVIIVFKLGMFDNFMIKIQDMFYDRKVFWNGFSAVEDAGDFLNTDFLVGSAPMMTPLNHLFFTRSKAIEGFNRNKALIINCGINLNYTIFGDRKDDAKKLLEIGAFDYDYNELIQNDSIFVHKIFSIDFTLPPITSTSLSTTTSPDSSTTIVSYTPDVTLPTTFTAFTPEITMRST